MAGIIESSAGIAQTVLPQEVGYFVVIGFGAIFAVLVTMMIKAETRYLGTKPTSEWFNTAGRTVKTGLTAAAIVSAWTWAATLLQSSSVAYQYGISGPFWYAAGASIQVLLFGILAIQLKRKAPNSHTFLEIIRARYGNASHKVFLIFALMTNMIVTAMLLLGGAAVVNGLTGMDISLAAFLIPLGVLIYTMAGGLKATFIADYLHTAIIFVVLLIFVTTVYIFSPITGGVQGMFDKLATASALNPVEGNAGGAYLTMASVGGLIFGIINIVGNFGTVFVDQAYWQRAIAARPSSAVKGYLVGGLAWFSIPFTLATTLGLAAVAIGVSLTPAEVSLGLTAPSAAAVLMGDVGAILILTMLFMAVTSAGSAELVAVSSLITYDVYRTYRNPRATGAQLLKVSKYTIVAFGIGMGGLAIVLLQAGLSLGYVYLAMGVIIGSAVIPIALTLLWKKTTKAAATGGAVAGLVAGLAAWFMTAQMMFGEVSLASTGANIPLLAGNVAAIIMGGAIEFLGSLVKPANFDFKAMRDNITLVDEGGVHYEDSREKDEIALKKAFKFSVSSGLIMTLVLVVAWPIPLHAAGYVFDAGFYTLWVVIAMVWASGAAAVIIGLPVVEARGGIARVLKGMAGGKRVPEAEPARPAE